MGETTPLNRRERRARRVFVSGLPLFSSVTSVVKVFEVADSRREFVISFLSELCALCGKTHFFVKILVCTLRE